VKYEREVTNMSKKKKPEKKKPEEKKSVSSA
jgi:hypothetical protein